MAEEYNALLTNDTWLVAQGQHQQHGVDYDETFSLVVKPSTIRSVLTTAASKNWSVRQLDIENAFHHGHLSETIYLKQPTGFVNIDYPHYVSKLNKALYGLKEAPRAWFHWFASYLSKC
ncbi:hypothetical protein LIER_35716 [Lithospermum erythrorhizon]|uniref:Reverse transcriptase Ty1/copia-type domain-containing protein n=1 Tax=Lithospermum erythrorhizon TaxID=34254 RepID=A0AAV3NVB3_LITER